MISSSTPATPTTSASTTIAMSSSRTPTESSTTPSDGSVSNPENGGARNAPSEPASTSRPKTMLLSRWSKRNVARGREKRSSQRIDLVRRVMKRCCVGPASGSRRQRSGSQMSRRPAINWSARSMATSSNTCVAPPVGSGSAETPSSRMNSSAKLFCSNSSMMPPSVLSRSLRSQRSSSSLALGPASGGGKVRLGPWKNVRKLAARVDLELAEHLPQVPLDGARAQKQARADLRVRKPLGSEPRNLELLGGELVACLNRPLAHFLPGREQFVARTLCEQVHADG